MSKRIRPVLDVSARWALNQVCRNQAIFLPHGDLSCSNFCPRRPSMVALVCIVKAWYGLRLRQFEHPLSLHQSLPTSTSGMLTHVFVYYHRRLKLLACCGTNPSQLCYICEVPLSKAWRAGPGSRIAHSRYQRASPSTLLKHMNRIEAQTSCRILKQRDYETSPMTASRFHLI